ncbi:retrovirus-related pol polyprotein from transposon TNT 1-94 [Tanacetum coccineum]|uniref:Retrovirus-related pol polyprotein from transposon TNT 1-94 n=1 Tax=Tanacetum coccineum TaxID=301880 RepID=A0ABQ5HXS1_9ASTR
MTGDREKFKNVDETPKSQVRLGDDKQVQVEGNGTVVVTLQGRERMCWFYFLTYKSEAFGFFKKFKALAENQSNRKLKNGIVERKNRTIVEMARCMLKAKNLEDAFWAETVATAVYLTNISPTKAVWNITSFEAWQESKPSVSHFRIFGCTCYALIPSGGAYL